MESVFQALSFIGSLGGAYDSFSAGEKFASGINTWFAENDVHNSLIISDMLNSKNFGGLDWLLRVSLTISWGNSELNENGDAAQNGYWEIFDMIDLLAGEFCTWIKAHDIYPSIVMNYFIHLRPGPDDGSIGQPAGIDLSFKLFS